MALEPRVLADTLAIMLRARGDEAVVDPTGAASTDAGRYDVVMASQVPSGEGVEVTLAVPLVHGERPVWGRHATVTVNDARARLRLLDEQLSPPPPLAPS